MNNKIVLNVVGALVFVTGIFMALCLIPAWSMDAAEGNTEVFWSFLWCTLSCLACGLLIFLKTRVKADVGFREGFAVVTFGWLAVSGFGALPYLWICKDPAALQGTLEAIKQLDPSLGADVIASQTAKLMAATKSMSVADAFFETMSGFTTTGCSILKNIEEQPYAILFWRSLTNWLGGMGIVVLSLAILPVLGIGGMQLYKAEVPGPTSDQLTARIASTAKILWGVYFLLSLVLLIILKVMGMNWFDSICHTFSTLATGGFSTKNNSIGAYPGQFHAVITVFMFLAGCNFVLHIRALRGKPLFYFKDEEFRFYLYCTLTATAIVTVLLVTQGNTKGEQYGFWQALNSASFQVVSIITTTGFGSDDFTNWPTLGVGIIVLLFFFGGCGGSTSGGMKVSRLMLLLKYSVVQVKQCLLPHALTNVQLNHKRVQPSILDKVMSFFFLYIALYVAISLLMCLCDGIDVETAFTCSIACLGNIGPGLSQVGPSENFSWMPDSAKWMLSLSMLIGRLEVYTVIVLFLPQFWKK
jgi:trk system potassium uptake protein TrkH